MKYEKGQQAFKNCMYDRRGPTPYLVALETKIKNYVTKKRF